MIDPIEIVLRLLLAAGLGSLVGFERERSAWAAGLRTHMMVCVGSTLFMIVSIHGFGDVQGVEGFSIDPARVAAQVASGIGFLGAGTIILRGEMVRGLTTAAGLWAVAAVGLAVGGGLYLAAGAATLVMLLILAGLKPVEKRVLSGRQKRVLKLTVERASFGLAALEQALGRRATLVRRFVVEPNGEDRDTELVTIGVGRPGEKALSELIKTLSAMPGVRSVEISAE